MYTVHLVFQAHLDPIWLWPWQAGLDEALATCRSACDRLDAHPDIFFTQGEAWVYRQIQLLDPALFERIKAHVAAGRWEIGGGWWTQPDCNAPDFNGLEHQISIGKAYFKKNFNFFPDYGFNPDSFGHNASLPGLMTAAGQHNYIFMRPQEHELELPANLFRWRGFENGPAVTAFRIGQSYGLNDEAFSHERMLSRLQANVTLLPKGITHTMIFAGIGDHGGGPTERLINQLKKVMGDFPGFKIIFSTPSRFFKAIEKKLDKLPVVTGELQHHAIGCYTVHREGKLALQKATQRMTQAEIALKSMPKEAGDAKQLEEHWRNVVFHQFHDTLGGTCIPSAYRHVRNQLGAGEAWAEEKLQYLLRKKMAALPDDVMQRMVFLNASDHPFDGWTAVEPWLEGKPPKAYRLIDEDGKPIPYQLIARECLLSTARDDAFLLRISLAPNEMKVIRLQPMETEATESPLDGDGFMGDAYSMGNANGAAVAFYPPELVVGSWMLALPEPILYSDPSDTWSHSIDRYSETPDALPSWSMPELIHNGAHFKEILRKGRIGDSELLETFRLYADSGDVELILRVNWLEHNKILKLVMPISAFGDDRLDAIPGAGLKRKLDGKERPIQGWTKVDLDESESLAVLCPDVFAMDATAERLRFTLLRSPQMAHHDPCPGGAIDRPYSDRGEHVFRFRFKAGSFTTEQLYTETLAMLRPLIFADLTRGMIGYRNQR